MQSVNLPAWSYEHRLSRFWTSGGTFRLLALDHGLSHGVLDGIHDCDATLSAAIAAGFTGVILNPGMISRTKPTTACGVIVQLFGCPQTVDGKQIKQELASVEDALIIGADGVALQLSPFSKPGLDQLSTIAKSLMRAVQVGMPSILMVNLDSPKEFTPDRLLQAVRIATELGATFVKVPMPSRFSRADLKRIRDATAVSCFMLLAGGPLRSRFEDVLTAAKAANFSGVCLGRNFFQSPHRDRVVKALREIFP